MKTKAIILGIALGAAMSGSPVASAIPVTCINCSNTLTQTLQFAKQLQEYLTQLDEYKTQIDQWKLQELMGKHLSGMQFDNALTMIRNIEGIMQSGSQITYNINNLQTRFFEDYPTASETFNRINQMPSASYNPLSLWNSFFRDEKSIRQNQDMMLQAMQSLKSQSVDLARDQSMMARANSQLSGSVGHEQSIQATAVYAQHSAQQLMKLRQGIALMTQIAIQEQADRSRREAFDRAAVQKWTVQRPGKAARTPRGASDY